MRKASANCATDVKGQGQIRALAKLRQLPSNTCFRAADTPNLRLRRFRYLQSSLRERFWATLAASHGNRGRCRLRNGQPEWPNFYSESGMRRPKSRSCQLRPECLRLARVNAHRIHFRVGVPPERRIGKVATVEIVGYKSSRTSCGSVARQHPGRVSPARSLSDGNWTPYVRRGLFHAGAFKTYRETEYPRCRRSCPSGNFFVLFVCLYAGAKHESRAERGGKPNLPPITLILRLG